jgi:hypothetical protein
MRTLPLFHPTAGMPALVRHVPVYFQAKFVPYAPQRGAAAAHPRESRLAPS